MDCVLVQRASNIAGELYLAMLVDRPQGRIAVIASQAGGMDIEEVAATEPDKILTFTIDPLLGLLQYQCRLRDHRGAQPVVPLMVRDTGRTQALVQHLKAPGILATGLYYPVVPGYINGGQGLGQGPDMTPLSWRANSMRKPPTGVPCAGEPPTRFGGRGGR